MKRLMQMSAVILSMALLTVTAVRAETAKDYVELSAPQPTTDPAKVEVIEMFWYGCPHCNQLEPLLESWSAVQSDDVMFMRMPAVLSPRWEILARAYYTAELLGVLKETHAALFKAIHVEKQTLDTDAALAALFAKHGVDEKQFTEAFNSFGVSSKVNRARQMTQKYALSGVPALIINGKYRTSASEAGSHEAMLKVADRLIEQERAGLAGATK